MDATITTSLFESCTTIQKESTFALQNALLSFTSHFSFPTTMSLAQQEGPIDVWEQPFAMQPFSEYYEITNLDVAGVSSLTLGAIYLFSFMYYHYILEQEQSIALAKQNAKAAQQQQQQEDAQEETLQIAPEIHEVPSVKEEEMVMSSHNVAVVPVLNPDEEMDVKKARAAVDQAKKFHFAARMQERKRKATEQIMEVHQNEMQEEILPTKRRRGRLWRWLRRSGESG
jgi:hypothetical protein